MNTASSQASASSGKVPAASNQASATSVKVPAASSQASAANELAGHTRYMRLDEAGGLGALARGSFGAIYIALDKTTSSTVVVKRQRVPGDAAARELAFYKALGQYLHPNVMPLLDHFIVPAASSQAFLYMVFDVMDGDLWHLWKHHRRLLPMKSASRLLRQLVEGVAHLHGLDIVHGDLSMANMLIRRDGGSGFEPSAEVLRISDFGGAGSAHRMVLQHGEVITTEYCRAPEVFLGESILSSAIDLWAVGIAGIALLCGSTIFWREHGYEPDVRGFEPRTSASRDWQSIFANQALVLGPISESVWPGCERFPAWGKVAGIMARPPLYERLGQALADSGLVRRPLASDGAGAKLLEDWIRWKPAARLAAQDSLGAAFFSECVVGPPAVVELAVKSCSRDVLATMVLQSWWNGTSVTLGTLAPSAEQHAASSQDTPEAPAAQASGETAEGIGKRRRLSKKTEDAVMGEEAASSQAGPHGFQPRACACKGNCGHRLCRSASVKKQRCTRVCAEMRLCQNAELLIRVCTRDVVAGEAFCARCKCESCGRGRQAAHGHGRWCFLCGKQQTMSARTYHNEFGQWVFGADWDASLRCAARSAFVTCRFPSEDSVKWHAFLGDFDIFRSRREQAASSQDAVARGAYTDGDVFFLCLVSLVKWPSLVSEALNRLRLSGVDPLSASPADWRAYLILLLHLADGKPMSDELRSISLGRTASCTGIIWIAKRWKVMRRVMRTRRDGATLLKLGCLQQEYELLPEDGAIAEIGGALQMVRMASLASSLAAWGQDAAASSQVLPSNETTTRFVSNVGALSRGICGKGSEVASGTLARALLMVVERRCGPKVWDACRMKELADVLPDRKANARPIENALAKDVRRWFGMSPLVVSAMACMWDQVPIAARKVALASSYANLLRAAEKSGHPHVQPCDWAAFL